MYARHAPLWASTYHAFQISPYGKYREHYKPVVFGFSKKYLGSVVSGIENIHLKELIKKYIAMTEGDEEDDFWNVITEKLIKILNNMNKSYKEGLALVEQLLMGPILKKTTERVGIDKILTQKYQLTTDDSREAFSTKQFINAFFNVFKQRWQEGYTYAERSRPVTVSAKGSTYSFVPVDRREDDISDRPLQWDEWLHKHDTELSKEYPYRYDMTLQLKGELKRTMEKVRLEKKLFYELLTPGYSVNAEVINYYLLMLQERENSRCDMFKHGINVYFYDTEFYNGYENAESSAYWYYHIWKTRDLDYAYVRYLFIPVTLPNHFTCFMIDIRQKKVYYYDSLHYHVPIKFLHTFGEYVIETQRPECREALGWLVEVKNDFENADGNVRRNEHLIVYNDVQQEYNYSGQYYNSDQYYDRANDCAMFVCQFMKELSKDPENLEKTLANDLYGQDYEGEKYSHHFPHCFEPGRGNYYRRRMANEIRTNSLDHPIPYETHHYPQESVEKQEAINTLLPYIPYYHYLHGQAFALSVEELNKIIGYMESNFQCLNCKRKKQCRVCRKIADADNIERKKRRGGDVKYAEVDTLN